MRSKIYDAGLAALFTHTVLFIFIGCPGTKAGQCFNSGNGQGQRRAGGQGGQIHLQNQGHEGHHVQNQNHAHDQDQPHQPERQWTSEVRPPTEDSREGGFHTGEGTSHFEVERSGDEFNSPRKRRQAKYSNELNLFIASLEAFGKSVSEIKNKYSVNVYLDKVIAKNANILKYAKMVWPDIGGGKEVSIKPEVFTENIKPIVHYYLGLDEKTLPELVQKHVDHRVSKPTNQHLVQDPFQKFKMSLEDFATSFKAFKVFMDSSIQGDQGKDLQTLRLINNVLAKNGNILAMVNKAFIQSQNGNHCELKDASKTLQQEENAKVSELVQKYAKDLTKMYLRKLPEKKSHPLNAGQRDN